MFTGGTGFRQMAICLDASFGSCCGFLMFECFSTAFKLLFLGFCVNPPAFSSATSGFGVPFPKARDRKAWQLELLAALCDTLGNPLYSDQMFVGMRITRIGRSQKGACMGHGATPNRGSLPIHAPCWRPGAKNSPAQKGCQRVPNLFVFNRCRESKL